VRHLFHPLLQESQQDPFYPRSRLSDLPFFEATGNVCLQHGDHVTMMMTSYTKLYTVYTYAVVVHVIVLMEVEETL